MKLWFLPAALITATLLLLSNGCADPEPVAKVPSKPEAKSDSDSRARAAPSSNERAKSKAPDGREPALDSIPDSETTKTRNSSGSERPADVGGTDSSKRKVDAKKSRQPAPKKEFKLEFVDSKGEEGLEPGYTIPNIEGKDIDGIKFQLDDYRGKVIMIDFWGDW